MVTAPTYGAIRGVTSVLDLALSKLQLLVDQAGIERGPLLAALNGVLGDYLAATDSALAIQIRLLPGGADVPSTAGGRLLVLVHGSSLDETCWLRNGHDHGASLSQDCGWSPRYLRYNSGRHVSDTGCDFVAVLEESVRAWPRPLDEVVLIGHNMGGLVARSACATGEGHAWRSKLRALIILGTLHYGAPLERGGNWIDVLLESNRYSKPLGNLGKLRSAGVADLRYGNVREADHHGRDANTQPPG